MASPDPALTPLVAAARAGSAQALGEVLQSFRGYLLAIAERELEPDLRSKGGASDLVQETFLKAQREFGGFQGSTEPELRAWLRQILRNNVTDFSRQYLASAKRGVGREVSLAPADSASPGTEVPADTPSPSGQAMAHEYAQQLARALTELPEEYRKVIHYRYHDELSFEQIGALLELTPNAARKLWVRAIKKLQQQAEKPP